MGTDSGSTQRHGLYIARVLSPLIPYRRNASAFATGCRGEVVPSWEDAQGAVRVVVVAVLGACVEVLWEGAW